MGVLFVTQPIPLWIVGFLTPLPPLPRATCVPRWLEGGWGGVKRHVLNFRTLVCKTDPDAKPAPCRLGWVWIQEVSDGRLAPDLRCHHAHFTLHALHHP